MNPLWLLLIIPGYAFIGGFVHVLWHNRKDHNKKRCNNGDDAPTCIFAGIFWPALIPIFILLGSMLLGMQAESLRPVARREMRDKKIRELEKENGIGPASQDS